MHSFHWRLVNSGTSSSFPVSPIFFYPLRELSISLISFSHLHSEFLCVFMLIFSSLAVQFLEICYLSCSHLMLYVLFYYWGYSLSIVMVLPAKTLMVTYAHLYVLCIYYWQNDSVSLLFNMPTLLLSSNLSSTVTRTILYLELQQLGPAFLYFYVVCLCLISIIFSSLYFFFFLS